MTTAAAAAITQGMVTEAGRYCPECDKASPDAFLCQYMQLRPHASCLPVSLNVSGYITGKACSLATVASFLWCSLPRMENTSRMMS